MEKKYKILISVICFLAGIITGIFIAPIKQGIGNNCGNTYHYHKDTEKKEKEEQEEEDVLRFN